MSGEMSNAALTDEQAQQLRDDYTHTGITLADVAERYGVSKSTAHRIIRHERYPAHQNGENQP